MYLVFDSLNVYEWEAKVVSRRSHQLLQSGTLSLSLASRLLQFRQWPYSPASRRYHFLGRCLVEKCPTYLAIHAMPSFSPFRRAMVE